MHQSAQGRRLIVKCSTDLHQWEEGEKKPLEIELYILNHALNT